MKNALEGFRQWFKALGDTARLMIPGEAEYQAQQRAADWNRVSALAGLTPDGAIAPPPLGITISRKPVTWRKGYDGMPRVIGYRAKPNPVDQMAQAHVEGRSR